VGCGGLRLSRHCGPKRRTRGRAASGRAGEALPLVDILAKVRRDLGGEIVGVSFERKQDIWLYEFKVVEPGGRLVEVYVDAASGRLLKREAD
jgi:uncharacterized membrane protein YkoI